MASPDSVAICESVSAVVGIVRREREEKTPVLAKS
jgi:hypothetical protein